MRKWNTISFPRKTTNCKALLTQFFRNRLYSYSSVPTKAKDTLWKRYLFENKININGVGCLRKRVTDLCQATSWAQRSFSESAFFRISQKRWRHFEYSVMALLIQGTVYYKLSLGWGYGSKYWSHWSHISVQRRHLNRKQFFSRSCGGVINIKSLSMSGVSSNSLFFCKAKKVWNLCSRYPNIYEHVRLTKWQCIQCTIAKSSDRIRTLIRHE